MERNRLARQIIDTCLEMTRLGLNQGTAGNVSVRYDGGMLITPTGIPYEKLTESHIVWIDANGQHEQGNCRRASGVFIWPPTRPGPMHRPWCIITRCTARRYRSSIARSRRSTT
jgi:hypothetical protein